MTNLPEGFRIERIERGRIIEFAVFEDGGPTWESGSPRSLLEVHLRQNEGEERFGGPAEPEIGWPSTSDKRPELARALAVALTLAADEVERKEES